METDIELSSYESKDDFGYVRHNIESGSPDHSKAIKEYLKGINEAVNLDALFQDISFNVFHVK